MASASIPVPEKALHGIFGRPDDGIAPDVELVLSSTGLHCAFSSAHSRR